MEKGVLRKEFLARRNSLPDIDVARLSALITARFLNSSCFLHHSNFLLYLNAGNEVATREIIDQSVKAGKNIYLPIPQMIDGRPLIAPFVSWNSMDRGAYGIAFPKGAAKELPETDITLVVMPGIAFDESGTRIGYGKGFYDRLLGGTTIEKVAFAYDFQVYREKLPAEKHDVSAGMLFTETRTIICHI